LVVAAVNVYSRKKERRNALAATAVVGGFIGARGITAMKKLADVPACAVVETRRVVLLPKSASALQ
jgi:hypothetical protein